MATPVPFYDQFQDVITGDDGEMQTYGTAAVGIFTAATGLRFAVRIGKLAVRWVSGAIR